MKNLLLLTCICLMAFTNNAFAQYDVLDFEPAGLGAGFAWTMSDNGANPPMTFVANPDMTGNASATVAEFNATVGGWPWALTFTDIDEFEFDATNSMVKIWVWKPTISNIGIKFEGPSAPIEINVSNTLTNQWEEITIDFSGSIGNIYNRIVVIPDNYAWSGWPPAPRPQDNILYIDDINIPSGNIVPPLEPTVGAPVPMHSEDCNGVISIFSDAYTNVAGTNLNPYWNQATQTTQELVGGNNTLKYANLNYQGTQFGSNQDVSGLDYLHVDVWTSTANFVDFYLISPGLEIAYPLPIADSVWVSVDIPLSAYVPPVNLADVFQFKVVGDGVVYFDNFYFYKDLSHTLPVASTPAAIMGGTGCDNTDGYTYYDDVANPGDLVFAINWAPDGTLSPANAAAKAAAAVSIDVQAAIYSAVSATQEVHAMGRNWNVDVAGLQMDEAVSVKFYFDPAEKAAAEAATAASALVDNGFMWWKTNSGPYDHVSIVTVPMFQNNVMLLTPAGYGMDGGIDYVQFDGLTSFSGGSGGGIAGAIPVPTMGEWGLIFLALVFLSMNMAFFFAPKAQMAGTGKGFNVSFKQFPFNGKSYQKAMILALALGAVMLGTTFMIWGTITMVDMIGGMICLPVFAYLTHFFIKENA